VADDPAGIHAGVAPDDRSLARACVRGRWGLNVSQRFVDYAGTRFDFPGFADLGEYSMPSRIVQLAALGVPAVSFVGSDEAARSMAKLFPPVVTVRDPEQLTALVIAMRDDIDGLSARSDEMYAWYARHYTASARARFLEQVLVAPRNWTALEAARRATAFLEMPSRSDVVDRLIIRRNRASRAIRQLARHVG